MEYSRMWVVRTWSSLFGVSITFWIIMDGDYWWHYHKQKKTIPPKLTISLRATNFNVLQCYNRPQSRTHILTKHLGYRRGEEWRQQLLVTLAISSIFTLDRVILTIIKIYMCLWQIVLILQASWDIWMKLFYLIGVLFLDLQPISHPQVCEILKKET